MDIADDDRVTRELMYADQFDGDAVSAGALLQFLGNRNADGSFDESLALLKLTTPENLHQAGCDREKRLIVRVTEKRQRRGAAGPPVPGEDRPYYCGFSQADAGGLRIEGEAYQTEVVHTPEEGPAHVSIYLRPKEGKHLVANDRTEAGRRLALAFRDPVGHLCPGCEDDEHHPLNKFGPDCLKVT
jgi:hypothetical protein